MAKWPTLANYNCRTKLEGIICIADKIISIVANWHKLPKLAYTKDGQCDHKLAKS